MPNIGRRSFMGMLGIGAAGCAVAGVAKAAPKPRGVTGRTGINDCCAGGGATGETGGYSKSPTVEQYRSSIKVSIISDEQREVLERLYNQSDFELWEKYGNTRRT